MECAEIVFPLPLDQSFLYRIPEVWKEKAQVGKRALAPLGKKILTGFIIGIREAETPSRFELKEIKEVLDESPVFSTFILRFTRELSQVFGASWGELLRLSLPPTFILKSQEVIFLTEKGKEALVEAKLSLPEKRLLTLILQKPRRVLYLKTRMDVHRFEELLKSLERREFIGRYQIFRKERKKRGRQERNLEGPFQLELEFVRDSELEGTAEKIWSKFQEQKFCQLFLQGGREAREFIYFYLIRHVLSQSGKVLILVPEVRLSFLLGEKLKKNMGGALAFLHSQLSGKEREREWEKIRENAASIILGSRVALFAPVENLRLIIIDEEHDDSFYPSDPPSYDVRFGARLRGKMEKIPVLFGSETPSVENYYRAKKRGYLLSLKEVRKARRLWLVDSRKEKGPVSRILREKIEERLRRKEQVVIFSGRRGYAPYVICPSCQYIPKCERCDISLSYHKRENELLCHYCNFSLKNLQICPRCGRNLKWEKGIGIEAVEEELKKSFPRARIVLFDPDAVRSQKDQQEILQKFKKKKIDILLGTQLLAYQVDFPAVCFLAILQPEISLFFGDFRASAKTFETLKRMISFLHDNQEAEAVIQTLLPEHYSIQSAISGDDQGYYDQELEFRRLMNYPPFSQMMEVVFRGENLRLLAKKAREFLSLARLRSGVEILGPAKAAFPRLMGKHRLQFILKAKNWRLLLEILQKDLSQIKVHKTIRYYR